MKLRPGAIDWMTLGKGALIWKRLGTTELQQQFDPRLGVKSEIISSVYDLIAEVLINVLVSDWTYNRIHDQYETCHGF